MQGTETAIFLALCLVTFIMVTGLSSFMLALVSVISLVTGLIFTAAFAILTVGELNLISVAFAVLYIGLGVDFAIHYCLRYREHLLDGTDRARALDETSVNIGDSLFLCAVSTAIGFFAFIPTDFTGVAELGWISGVGMFVSFVVTLTVIPALLSLLPYNAGRAPGDTRRRTPGGTARRKDTRRHGLRDPGLRRRAGRPALRPQSAEPAPPRRRRADCIPGAARGQRPDSPGPQS